MSEFENAKNALIGLVVLIGVAATFGLIGLTIGEHSAKEEQARENTRKYEQLWREKGFAELTKAKGFSRDEIGRPQINYDNTNYLFKVGTNGIPYFEPMVGGHK